MMRRIAFLLLPAVLLLGAACDGGGGDSATSSPTQPEDVSPTPALTATPAPSPTPLGGVVPDGWERHSTANIQIDLPATWETFDPTEETLEAIVEALGNVNPEFESFAEEVQLEDIEFFAFDTQSVEGLTNFQILRAQFPVPVAIPATIAETEQEYIDLGFTVLATDSALTIGGLRAGRLKLSGTFGPIEVVIVQYLVMPEPNIAFFLTFSASSTQSESLEPVFQQMAESFRVLDPE